MARPKSPELIRIGRVRISRREFIKDSLIGTGGVAAGVLATLTTQYLINTHQEASEVVSTSEIVRGSLLGAYDENGNLITNSLVPGSHLIMIVSEASAPNFAVRSVQATGAFKGFEGSWPVIATIEGPNFGSNYLVVANLDHLGGAAVPKNSPFQVTFNVGFGGPGGQTGTKLNNPGPLQFTRT